MKNLTTFMTGNVCDNYLLSVICTFVFYPHIRT